MKKILLYIYLVLLLPGMAFAQKKVTGTVVDENFEALPGVSIIISGTSTGTITDINGSYSLSQLKAEDVLIFSFIGFEDQKVKVGKQTKIDVQMQPSDYALDQVVVVGYGTARKSDLTGAVASVNSREINIAPTANFDEALVGRIAGVNISANEGTPGAPMNITIRGGNSITGSNQPLYVVDGIPLESFDPATINSKDIKSFDVLKDASATAIYGSRGANGVIVITTKQGRTDGVTDINFGASYGFQYIPDRMEVMSPYEYVKVAEYQASGKNNWNGPFNVNEMDRDPSTGYLIGDQGFYNKWVDPELYRNMKGSDWQSDLFRTAPMQVYNLSMSGGNKKTNVYYSGNFTDQDGTLITTGFRKIVNNVRINHSITDKVKVNGALLYSNSVRTGPTLRETAYSSVIRDAVKFRPTGPIIWDGLGADGFDPEGDGMNVMFPPVPNLENTDSKNTQDVVRGNLAFNIDLAKGLKLRLSGNYQNRQVKDTQFFGQETRSGYFGVNGIYGQIEQWKYQNLSTSNTLTYNKKIKKHKFSVMGGFEASYNQNDYSYLMNSQLPTDEFGIDGLDIGTVANLARTSWTANSLVSYFSRATYDYKGKYLLTANFRADGSSKFPTGNKWGYFPSFSTAWKIGEEPFIKNLDFVSSLKVRGGWGISGNNYIGNFSAFNLVNASRWNAYSWGQGENFVPGSIQTNIAVPDLTWETTSQTNLGLDFSLFRYRVKGTIDLYKKNTYDLLLGADMALSTGFDRVTQNVGEVQNKGLELSLSTVNFDKGGFRWDTSINISFNRNKTIKLNDGQNEIFTSSGYTTQIRDFENDYITRIGEPVGMMYGLQFDGLYQVDDFNWDNTTQSYILKEGIPDNGDAVTPGSIRYIDQNNDGTIDENDRVIIGNPHPKHFGGLTNDFKYKGFDLSVLFQWSYGAEILNGNRVMLGSPHPTQSYNKLSEVADMWTPWNPDTDVNTGHYYGVNGNAKLGNMTDDRYIEDGSYLRLKTVALGYTLPSNIAEKLKMKKCRVYVSGQNLYTWTNYSGYDPEVSIKGSALMPNLDYSSYPRSLTVMGGIDITF
ncbi:TonB-dependent receptor [Labilibacter sediminis]|nr:TonB-dependent receptor [Labilibacter sediminis]